jgi:hypothetical protein
MPRSAVLPPALRYKPFRGSVAVAAGLLTARQLDGSAWRRFTADDVIHNPDRMLAQIRAALNL